MVLKGDFRIDNIDSFTCRRIDDWHVVVFPNNKKYLVLDAVQKNCFDKFAAGENIVLMLPHCVQQ